MHYSRGALRIITYVISTQDKRLCNADICTQIGCRIATGENNIVLWMGNNEKSLLSHYFYYFIDFK